MKVYCPRHKEKVEKEEVCVFCEDFSCNSCRKKNPWV